MSDPMKELQDLYRVFEFKNKTNQIKTVELAAGDSVRVQPRSVLKLQSAKFHQLPSMSEFQFIAPTLDDLRAVGLIKSEAPKSESNSTSQPAGEAE